MEKLARYLKRKRRRVKETSRWIKPPKPGSSRHFVDGQR